MALKNLFDIVKADRYTADGREEIIKAQEGSKPVNTLKSSSEIIRNLKEGQEIEGKDGGKLRIDYIGPNAINYSFEGENHGHNQATREQLKTVLEANGFATSDAAPRILTGDTRIRVRKA